ncbi:MAG: MarR family transcriptional regulator [Fischerella sp. CENA71]|nr:MarR family transcriptional regulator [Fischerella sp. CENA71]
MNPKSATIGITSDQCATKLMETIPTIMQFFRAEMRRNASVLPVSLSIPQFRTLAFLDRHPGASVSPLAEHLGVSRPTASNLTDRLVQKNLVSRTEHPQERRHVVLTLTEVGKYHLQQARTMTSAKVAKLLATLPEEQLVSVADGLTVLSRLFLE